MPQAPVSGHRSDGGGSGVEVDEPVAEALLEAAEEGDDGAQPAGDGVVDLGVERSDPEIGGELPGHPQQSLGLAADVALRPDPVPGPLLAQAEELDLAGGVDAEVPEAAGLQHAALGPGEHDLEAGVVQTGTQDIRVLLVLDEGVTRAGEALLDALQGHPG